MDDAKLYIVPTPIGNLGDMVPRAVEVLQQVDLIAAEDTRHSAVLCRHFGIDTPMMAYHDHADERRVDTIVARLQQGQSVALISDAGTPLISDPGYRIVDRAHREGVVVVPIPGACALIAGLSAAGLPTDRFLFEGFLPAKQQARRKQLESYREESRTVVFYEAPHRLLDSVEDMEDILGAERVAVLARELSKQFETIQRLPLGELRAFIASDKNQQRGECVLMLRGSVESSSDIDPEARRALLILAEELPLKQAAALTAKLYGAKKNALYKWALEHGERN